MKKSNAISWLFSEYVESAYLSGLKAKEKDINPFSNYTNEWYSWNRGYNQMMFNL